MLKKPISAQIKIWFSLWIISIVILTPFLAIIVRGLGIEKWQEIPLFVKVALIALPMVIIMPPLGEWLTKRFTKSKG